jgi:hypothetical protein
VPSSPEPVVPRYRPLSARRRLLVVLLAVSTAIAIVLVLLDPPGGVQRKRASATASPAPCADGQTVGCVGGVAEVIVPPPRRAASVGP